jgi:MFS family permease
MPGIQTMTAATIGGAMVFGMMLALLGRLKLAATQPASVEDGSLRRWLLVLNVTLIPLMLLSGVLLDIYGARPLLVAGSVMLAVALVLLKPRISSSEGPGGIAGGLATMLLAAFGASAVGAASIVLMPYAFFVSEETSAGLNLGFVFLALGALLSSVLADILLKKIGFRRTLALFALASLMLAFVTVLPSAHWQIAEHSGNPSALFAEPACWLAALVLFFYVPLEASISMWTFRLLAERGEDERGATGLLSGFWAAFMASRLLAALAQHTVFFSDWWQRGLIVIAPLLSAVLLGNLAGAGQRGRPRGGLILLGLLLGPVLPTLLSLIFEAAADAKGTSYGVMFAAGSLGSVLLAPLLTTRWRPTLQIPLRLPSLLAVLVMVIALVFGLMLP